MSDGVRSNVKYDADLRALAKERQHALCTIDIDGRTTKKKSGRITVQGPWDERETKMLWRLVHRLIRMRSKPAAKAK